MAMLIDFNISGVASNAHDLKIDQEESMCFTSHAVRNVLLLSCGNYEKNPFWTIFHF